MRTLKMISKEKILKKCSGDAGWEASDYELQAMDKYAKQMSVLFFKWNTEKVGAFVTYLQEFQKIARSNEIEENLAKFEGSTIEERYDMFINYLNKQK